MKTNRPKGIHAKLKTRAVVAEWRRCKRCLSDAAKKLGVSTTTVRYHLRKAGVVPPAYNA
jgi:hypothetical protein